MIVSHPFAANVTLDPQQADPQFVALAGVQGTQRRPLLPAYEIREVDGVLYYVANSQYARVRDDGALETDRLREPTVLRLRLGP